MTRPRTPRRDERLPARMRTYRIEAELRETPDLHKLAQLFIGMARVRAAQDGHHGTPSSAPRSPEPAGDGGVGSEQQEANG